MALSFQVSPAELTAPRSEEATFSSAQLLVAAYLTEADALSKSLPKGFEPQDQPVVSTFVARYPETNFGSSYHEAALMVSCKFNGEPGALCLGMVVDDDVALILGREVYGFPKKMADIRLEVEGDRVEASVTRRGTTFLEIEADLGGGLAQPQLPHAGPTFLVKAFPAADLAGLEWTPKVVKTTASPKARSFRPASKLDLRIRESDRDRWAAFPVKEVLFGGLLEADLGLAPGAVVGEIAASDWLPFLFANLR